MLKNKHYVYGEGNVYVPANIHFGEHMLHRFKEFKDAVAIIDPTTGKKSTYSALAQQTVDVALSLTRIGIRKGDVVSICSEERLEYMSVLLGAICCGASFSSTDTSGEATIKHRTQLSKPSIIFCSSAAFSAFEGSLRSGGCSRFVVFEEECSGSSDVISFQQFLTEHAPVEEFQVTPVDGWKDVAMFLFSSGTTGLPKAVPLSHLNVLVDLYTLIDVDYYKGKIISTATEFYTFGLGCLNAGATIVFSLKDEAKGVLESIHKHKVQILQQMPSTIFELARYPEIDKYDVSSLERILSASAPLRPELVEEVKKKFPNIKRICQAYGASEAGVMCSDELAKKGSKPASVGCACPGVVIKVVDGERRPVGVNEKGEICFKSPSVFPGYVGSNVENHLDKEGFYKTGDIGYYDEDRYFYIVDRIKDMIKYHGFAVAPAELEAVLVQHPAVLEAAVIGAPDEQYFELPTGFVVLQEGAKVDPQEITDFVNSKVAHWMPLAGGVRIIDSLPRGKRGKVDKKVLRKLL